MSKSQKFAELLSSLDDYITSCAEDASSYFKKYDIEMPLSEDVKIDLSPDICKTIYKDMIIEMLSRDSIMCLRFGFTSFMIPQRDKDGDMVKIIHLGVCYPDRKSI
jgi:hypothetical protein